MTHLDEGTLQALIDGQLSAPERRTAERHAEECTACANAVRAARMAADEVAAALQALDRPAPVEPARDAVFRRLATARLGLGSLPRAAVLVLGLAAAASAAVPGSPVRALATALIERIGGEPDGPDIAAVRSEEESAAPEGGAAGVALVPGSAEMRVSIGSSARDTRIRVLVVDTRELAVSAERSVGARFETGAGRIRVSATGPGTITVEIPRSLARAELHVDGAPYLRKQGDRLEFLVAPTDTTRTSILFDVGADAP